MKSIKVFLTLSLLMLAGLFVHAGNYSYTVSIPSPSSCSYDVCVVVRYRIGILRQTTVPVCQTIGIGSSNTFNITTPANATFGSVKFMVSGGNFNHTFTVNSETVLENCNTLSNPITFWTALSSNSFSLESQNILGG